MTISANMMVYLFLAICFATSALLYILVARYNQNQLRELQQRRRWLEQARQALITQARHSRNEVWTEEKPKRDEKVLWLQDNEYIADADEEG